MKNPMELRHNALFNYSCSVDTINLLCWKFFAIFIRDVIEPQLATVFAEHEQVATKHFSFAFHWHFTNAILLLLLLLVNNFFE